MSVIIKTSEMQYRDQLGNYHGVNAIAEKKIADQIADLDTAIAAQESRIDQDISAAQTAVDGIDAQRQTMIAAIASVAGQGTDTTLTQSGVAADSKSAGDEIRNVKSAFINDLENDDISWLATKNEGKYIKSDNTEDTNSSLSHTDYILIPDNAVKMVLGNQTSNVAGTETYNVNPNVLFYDSSKSLIKPVNVSTGTTATVDIPVTAVYCRVNQPASAMPVQTRLIRFVYDSVKATREAILDAIGENYLLDIPYATYQGAFSSGNTDINTGIILKQNVKYIIVNRTQLTGNVNVYGASDVSSNYKKLNGAVNVAVLTVTGADRYLKLYTQRPAYDSIDIEVYVANAQKVNIEPEIYVVNKTEPEYGQYTSFTQCLLDLKDNENEKIIYIDGGTYDIYQEYRDANVPIYTGDSPATEFYDYCVWIPKNTHIIGRGLVKLQWMPTIATAPALTAKMGRTVSPVNVAGSMTLENVEIHCKNGRYCIHDDPQKGGDPYVSGQFSGAIKKYKNVKCYKYPNETIDNVECGFKHTIGFGCHKEMHYEFENCYFGNTANGHAFYGHTEVNAGNETIYQVMSSDFTLNNCIIDSNSEEAVEFDNVNSTRLKCRVLFASCYFSGKVSSVSANSSDPGRPNAYAITFLNCNDVSFYCDDDDNPYPPKAYNTNLTIIE